MSLIINLSEVLKIKMRINLGGTNVCVAKQFLNGSKVAAGFQDMTGKGMPEHMRVYMQTITLFTGPRFDSGLDIGVADALAALADEQGVRIYLRAFRWGIVTDFQPILERRLGVAADR